MNNEPVAWLYKIKNTDNRWELSWIRPINDKFFETEPLYTHPAKTLTDEEIIEIGNAVTNLIDSNEGWIEFARAILKKASER